MERLLKSLVALLSAVSCLGHGAYYLPGVTPHAYEANEPVSVVDVFKVNFPNASI